MCNLMGCARQDSNQVQGYVEGEYVYVASPLSGTLESLCVQRGMNVKEGDPLFALDSTAEKAAPGRSGTPGFAGEGKPGGCKKGQTSIGNRIPQGAGEAGAGGAGSF